jgi:RimJ/RimL family protein N-acetyltransferase
VVGDIAFRRLSHDDLASLFSWLSRPHVTRWYAAAPSSFTEVVAKYGPRTQSGSPVEAYVIAVDGKDVGYIQTYSIAAFPEYAAQLDAGPGAAGMDLFIGEEMMLGWGLGTRAIRQFVHQVVFAQPLATACLAGPAEGNEASIRAFAKAGFRPWKTVRNERGETESVMRLERASQDHRLEPIAIDRDLETCIRFRRDMYLASFGTPEGLEEEMGPGDALYVEQLRARAAQLPEGNAHLWEGSRIVGQTELRLLEDEPGVGYVSLFYLVPECRGQGLGRMLQDHALEVFRARGMRAMRLSVSARNAPAIAFYRKLGWVTTGTRPHRHPMEFMEFPLA